MKKSPALQLLILLAAGSHAGAAVISTNVVNESATFFDSAIVSSLITTGQSSLVSVSVLGPVSSAPFTAVGLNNGSAIGSTGGTTVAGTLTFFTPLNGAGATNTVTFQLDQGYDITSISSLAGWGDSYLGSQLFDLYLEIGSSGSYGLVGSYGTTPFTGTPVPGFPSVVDDGFSVLTTITDNSIPGIIAGNVTGVRFIYKDPYPALNTSGTLIRELSVVGVATVPEPSFFALALLGGIAACARRRRM